MTGADDGTGDDGTGQEVTLVGIGADGWAGLGADARSELLAAPQIWGSPRQLDLLPAELVGRRVEWPTPMLPAVDELARSGGVALASGDPMFFGLGSTLARRHPAVDLRVFPRPSSVALAGAALGVPHHELPVISLLDRPLAGVLAPASDGARAWVLSTNGQTPVEVANILSNNGFGESVVTICAALGGPEQVIASAVAEKLAAAPREFPAPNVLLVEYRGPVRPRIGLPENDFRHDGQITKRDARVIAVSRLAPAPGTLLWDIGTGSGSVAIEWLRLAGRGARAVGFEPRPDRRANAAANAAAYGVRLEIVDAATPDELIALAPADRPGAIHVGGGASVPGLLDAAARALAPGGALVAAAVTIEGEAALHAARARFGGELLRIELSDAGQLGALTGWRPRRPLVQWRWEKP